MFEEKLKLEREDIQEKADNNAKILKALTNVQEVKVLNSVGVEMILPIERIEMVIESLNDLKAQIERYDTIENFIYE